MAILSSQEMFYQAYEPKLQNRFTFNIDGIPAYLVKTADRPKVSFDEVTLEHINLKRKIKGKADWQNMNCTLYDPVTPSGGYSDFYKKEVRFQTLGPVGDIVEEWVCKGAYVTSADFGSGDWSSSSPMEINLTLRMDYCILNY